jgi:hypothetical protein
LDGNILDDPTRLKAERDAADREYNQALTRLDAAIQRLSDSFPHPPPGPDEHQVTPLNTLWRIAPAAAPSHAGGMKQHLAQTIQRAVAPLFEQQQAFNSALVDHINRNVQVGRETQAAVASLLTVLRDTTAELVRFQSLLVRFLQQITPYVDTRDRDVAGLLRGLSGAINAVADELMKRTETLTARDRRRDAEFGDLTGRVDDLHARLDRLAGALRATGPST